MLTVRDAAAAVEFYRKAFAAIEEERFTAPTGHIVVRMSIEGLPFFVVDENPEAFNLSPESLSGTSVRINLMVEDPDACASRAIAAGAHRALRGRRPALRPEAGSSGGSIRPPLADRGAADRL